MRILLCLLFSLVAVAGEAKPKSILFLGNSLTIYNDLHEMVRKLAELGGQPALTCDREVVGGSSLAEHWARGKAQAKLTGGTFDIFVIQGSSTEWKKDPESFATHVRLYAKAATETKTRSLLYMVWGRKGAADTQPAIAKAYQDAAAATGATVVPVGLAWDAYRKKNGEEALFRDSVHPTPLGTYLAACVFYSVIYGASPVGLSGEMAGLDAATAKELQETAWLVAKPLNGPKLKAKR
jgi:hypothetical protein